jgi:hypothetical protein
VKSWILLIPALVLGVLALGSLAPRTVKVNKMSNVAEIPGREGSRVDITEAARGRGHEVAMFGAG